MVKKIKFTSELADITLLFLMGVNLYENVAGISSSSIIMRIVQSVFLIVLFILYFTKTPIFKKAIITWGVLLILASLIGLLAVFMTNSDITSTRSLMSIFGLLIGIIFYHIGSDYIEIELRPEKE